MALDIAAERRGDRIKPRADNVPDLARYGFPAAAGVDDGAALRLLGRDRQIGLAQLLVEFDIFGLEAVRRRLAAALSGARHPDFDRNIEHDGEIGHQIADGDALEASDQTMIDLPENALIDARRIDKTVADHPFAGFERRQNGALDMIVARRGEQHRLDVRPERLCRTRQQHMTDDLSAGRAARLTGQLHVMTESFEPQRQHGGLGRFSRALPAFQSDELPAHRQKLYRAARFASGAKATRVWHKAI